MKAHLAQVAKELAAFHKFVVEGEFVPSGGWCKCCERYDCGCDERARIDKEYDRDRKPT